MECPKCGYKCKNIKKWTSHSKSFHKEQFCNQYHFKVHQNRRCRICSRLFTTPATVRVQASSAHAHHDNGNVIRIESDTSESENDNDPDSTAVYNSNQQRTAPGTWIIWSHRKPIEFNISIINVLTHLHSYFTFYIYILRQYVYICVSNPLISNKYCKCFLSNN